MGDPAQEFALRAQDGEVVKLSDLLSRGSAVVYFYPKDKTPGCTAEAGAFRDSYAKFGRLRAEVVGISSDSRLPQGVRARLPAAVQDPERPKRRGEEEIRGAVIYGLPPGQADLRHRQGRDREVHLLVAAPGDAARAGGAGVTRGDREGSAGQTVNCQSFCPIVPKLLSVCPLLVLNIW